MSCRRSETWSVKTNRDESIEKKTYYERLLKKSSVTFRSRKNDHSQICKSIYRVRFFSQIIHDRKKKRSSTLKAKSFEFQIEKTLNQSIFEMLFWVSNEIFKTSQSRKTLKLWFDDFRSMIRFSEKKMIRYNIAIKDV